MKPDSGITLQLAQRMKAACFLLKVSALVLRTVSSAAEIDCLGGRPPRFRAAGRLTAATGIVPEEDAVADDEVDDIVDSVEG